MKENKKTFNCIVPALASWWCGRTTNSRRQELNRRGTLSRWTKLLKIKRKLKIFCTGKNQNLWEFLKVDKENPNMPGNLYILLGDETLELTIKQVENMRCPKKEQRIEIQIISQEQTFDGSWWQPVEGWNDLDQEGPHLSFTAAQKSLLTACVNVICMRLYFHFFI